MLGRWTGSWGLSQYWWGVWQVNFKPVTSLFCDFCSLIKLRSDCGLSWQLERDLWGWNWREMILFLHPLSSWPLFSLLHILGCQPEMRNPSFYRSNPHGKGNGNPLHCSCLGNLMDKGAWLAKVHGTARVGHDLATKPPPPAYIKKKKLPHCWGAVWSPRKSRSFAVRPTGVWMLILPQGSCVTL